MRVAFVIMGADETAPTSWLYLQSVDAATWSEMYFKMVLTNGRDHIELQRQTDKLFGETIARGIALAKARQRAPIVAALLIRAGILPNEDSTP